MSERDLKLDELARVFANLAFESLLAELAAMEATEPAQDAPSPTPGNPARSKGNDDAQVSTGSPSDGETVAS